MDQPIRLHIGGRERRGGWIIVDTEARPEVDVVGSCVDLSAFAAGSAAEVYASHVIEHLSHRGELGQALGEFFRVLAPGGLLRLAVPDLAELCRLYVHPQTSPDEKIQIMRLIYGGQTSPHDYHKLGLDEQTMARVLWNVGFRQIRRVDRFGLFQDTSAVRLPFTSNPEIGRARYSLNVMAVKP